MASTIICKSAALWSPARPVIETAVPAPSPKVSVIEVGPAAGVNVPLELEIVPSTAVVDVDVSYVFPWRLKSSSPTVVGAAVDVAALPLPSSSVAESVRNPVPASAVNVAKTPVMARSALIRAAAAPKLVESRVTSTSAKLAPESWPRFIVAVLWLKVTTPSPFIVASLCELAVSWAKVISPNEAAAWVDVAAAPSLPVSPTASLSWPPPASVLGTTSAYTPCSSVPALIAATARFTPASVLRSIGFPATSFVITVEEVPSVVSIGPKVIVAAPVVLCEPSVTMPVEPSI